MSTGASPVPVTVVSGFLGSGKTTLLRRVIADPELGPRVAILVNELGALGLDGELLGTTREGVHVATVELASGCLCCTLKGELAGALEELARPAPETGRAPPLHILVETSGAALASEVRFQMGVVALHGAVRSEGVVTLVDAANGPRAEAEAPEVFADQLRAADVVLLNKTDLVDDATCAARLEWLRARAPGAALLPVTAATVDVRLLLGVVPLAHDAAARPHHEAPVRPGAPPAAHGLESRAFLLDGAVEQERLEEWLEELSGRVFRIKGVVDSDHGPLLVQAVGDQVDFEPLPPVLASARRRLVFIGVHLDGDALAAGIAALTR